MRAQPSSHHLVQCQWAWQDCRDTGTNPNPVPGILFHSRTFSDEAVPHRQLWDSQIYPQHFNVWFREIDSLCILLHALLKGSLGINRIKSKTSKSINILWKTKLGYWENISLMNRDDVLVLANSLHVDIAQMFIKDVNVKEISFWLK